MPNALLRMWSRRRSDAIPAGLQRHGQRGGRMRGFRDALLAACVLLFAATQEAGAEDGPYVGVAAGWHRASGDYTKGIGLDVPPASYETATSEARRGVGTLRAALGYRTFVAGRLYVSGEFEAALQGSDGPAGYLREGTGVGDRDVWPGPWSVKRKGAFGMNTRLGYVPGGLLGEGGSVYVVAGVHWERATVRRGSDIGGEAIRVVADHTLRPWVVGRASSGGAWCADLGWRSGTRRLISSSAPAGMGRRSGCRASTTGSTCAALAFTWATPARSDRSSRVGQPVATEGTGPDRTKANRTGITEAGAGDAATRPTPAWPRIQHSTDDIRIAIEDVRPGERREVPI